MIPTLFNGFYLATNNRIGPYHIAGGSVTQEQKDNANAIKTFFVDQEGWTINAVCAILGNMMGESTLNPAFIQATNRYRLPNSAANLSDVPNSVMANFYREYYNDSRRAYGIGLVQWDGYTERANGTYCQKMVNYAIANNFNWYDGWNQCYRLRYEYQNDSTYHFFREVRVSGIYYTFSNFVTSTASVSDLTKAWSWGYERNAGGPDDRIPDAEYWYNYFTDPQTAPPPATILYPSQADPDQPYDPDHPVNPDDNPINFNITKWFWGFVLNKRKELKRQWRKV